MPLITEGNIYSGMSENVVANQARLLEAQQRVDTGKRVRSGSDDPAAAAQAELISKSVAQLQVMGKVASTVYYNMDHAATILNQSVRDVLGKGQSIMVAAKNGTLSAEDRVKLGIEMQGVHDQMLAVANTKLNGRFLFAGNLDDVEPFDASGNYSGDSAVRNVEIAPGMFASANIPGDQIFNVTGGLNILDALQTAANNLMTNNVDAMGDDLAHMESAVHQVANAVATVGSSNRVINNAAGTRDRAKDAMAASMGALTDIDPMQAYSDLVRAEMSLRASIAGASRVLQILNSTLFA